MKIDVCFTPSNFNAVKYAGYHAVVIDVLRATTNIATACANNCKCVIPVTTIEQAQTLKVENPQVLLAGERGGLIIPGFDLGNSPYEYSKSQVSGKTIVMTTTNGTLALNKAATSPKVYIMAFANISSVIAALHQNQENVVIICAGSEGNFSLEDTLCAGLAVDRLQQIAELSDTAMASQAMYRDFTTDLTKRVLHSSHASYLRRIGFEKDILLCLQQDTLDIIPIFTENTITA